MHRVKLKAPNKPNLAYTCIVVHSVTLQTKSLLPGVVVPQTALCHSSHPSSSHHARPIQALLPHNFSPKFLPLSFPDSSIPCLCLSPLPTYSHILSRRYETSRWMVTLEKALKASQGRQKKPLLRWRWALCWLCNWSNCRGNREVAVEHDLQVGGYVRGIPEQVRRAGKHRHRHEHQHQPQPQDHHHYLYSWNNTSRIWQQGRQKVEVQNQNGKIGPMIEFAHVSVEILNLNQANRSVTQWLIRNKQVQ